MAAGDRRLIVTGKTNLPPSLLGLRSYSPAELEGFTGWRWREGSPFANDDWDKLYVSSFRGFTVLDVEPAAGRAADILIVPAGTRRDSIASTSRRRVLKRAAALRPEDGLGTRNIAVSPQK